MCLWVPKNTQYYYQPNKKRKIEKKNRTLVLLIFILWWNIGVTHTKLSSFCQKYSHRIISFIDQSFPPLSSSLYFHNTAFIVMVYMYVYCMYVVCMSNLFTHPDTFFIVFFYQSSFQKIKMNTISFLSNWLVVVVHVNVSSLCIPYYYYDGSRSIHSLTRIHM